MVVEFMVILQRQPLQNMNIMWRYYQVSMDDCRVLKNSMTSTLSLIIMLKTQKEKEKKKGERRNLVNCDPIEVINILLASKIPVQIDQFWASPASKTLLQKLCCIFLKNVAKSSHLKIVLSGDGSISPCFERREDGTTQIQEKLKIFLEETDTQIILNI